MQKLLFLLAFLAWGCTRKPQDLSLLQGDWVTTNALVRNSLSDQPITFSFEDSLCSYLFASLGYSKYSLQNDTLLIKTVHPLLGNHFHGTKQEASNPAFSIRKLQADRLQLQPANAATQAILKRYNLRPGRVLKLRKLTTKNQIRFRKIGFYSTGCFGSCPWMYLEIDSLGHFLFHGKEDTNPTGLHRGQLPLPFVSLLSNKLQQLDLRTLKPYYAANWTDDQQWGLRITYADQSTEVHVYGYDKEPLELRILFNLLMDLYHHLALTPDSNVLKAFEFKEFMKGKIIPKT